MQGTVPARAEPRRDLCGGCGALDLLHGHAAQVRKKIAKLHTPAGVTMNDDRQGIAGTRLRRQRDSRTQGS